MDAVRRSVTVGALFSLASIVAMRGIGFLTSLLVARSLGPSGLGVYSILIGLHGAVVIVAGMGLTLIAPKLVAEVAPPGGEPAAEAWPLVRALLTTTGLAALASGVVVVILAPWLASLLVRGQNSTVPVMYAGLAVVGVCGSTISLAVLQGLHRIRRLAVLNVFVATLNLVLIVPAARRYGVAGVFGALALSHLTLTVTALLALPSRARRPGPPREILGPAIRRGLGLGWPLLLGTLIMPLVVWLTRTLLGHTAGLTEVGWYQVADTLNQAVLFVPFALVVPVYPLAASLAQSSREEASRTLGPILSYVALLTLPVSILVGWLAPYWVRLFGPAYGAAWPVVYVLSGGYFLSSVGLLSGALLSGFGLTRDGLVLNTVWSLLFVIPALFLAPARGALGMALAFTLSYAVYTAILLVYLRRRLSIGMPGALRVLVAWAIVYAAGGWILPRVPPAAGALLALAALGLTALAAGRLWRRALEVGRELLLKRSAAAP